MLNAEGNDYNSSFAKSKIIFFFIDSDLNVRSDQEIQAFREELVRPRSMNEGGECGMNVYHFTFGLIFVGERESESEDIRQYNKKKQENKYMLFL